MMNRVRKLWRDRAAWFWNDAIRYLKVILTGYMYVPIILLILLAFFYHYLLQAVPQGWNFGWILAPVVALALTRSTVRTFIQIPDPLFLLPMERRLGEYFRLSFLYSGITQGIVLFFILLILSPLYYAKISPNSSDFYGAFAILLLVKWTNIAATWIDLRFPSGKRRLHSLLRGILNLLLCLDLFLVTLVPQAVLFVLIVMGIGYYLWQWRTSRLNWGHLVEEEGKAQASFYSFAQWFMDVPRYTIKIKRHSFWIRLLNPLPKQRKWSHLYLYLRSFIRYEDVFGHYLRLTLLGMVFLWFAPHLIWAGIVFSLSLISNAVQLINSWNRLKLSFWDHIYPFPMESKRRGFQWSLMIFLIIQVVLLSISLFPFGFLVPILFLTIGVIFAYITTFLVMGKKITTKEA
ncbi:ABC transporter permease [Ammoniphilus sp. CFH 90114]|uniref:ABC transporter permease n=1 Tax=Ammoniphilus sp. CFH 90114 TaxID=2493665 RepID=UPI00100EC695|nr:ABC transporter permease [Ammoniphilus sp. CFH 90114]RXT04171.1 ABC transporter permease [Ammoniphilus sp. CFH 90114]